MAYRVRAVKGRSLQYGLVAEEVAEVVPGLVGQAGRVAMGGGAAFISRSGGLFLFLSLLAACGGGGGGTEGFNGSPVLFFSADNGMSDSTPLGVGRELWKTDGTDAGTVLAADINHSSGSSIPRFFTVFNGALYFQASADGSGTELWKSDGTGAIQVKEINRTGTNSAYENGSDPMNFTVFNGALYFSADDGTSGFELWKTDGTEAGTVLVKDINSGVNGSFPDYLTVFNGALYFSADNGTSPNTIPPGVGRELWKTDGTEAGTVRVKDIMSGSQGSNPSNLTVMTVF